MSWNNAASPPPLKDKRRSPPADAIYGDLRQMAMILHGPEIFDSGRARWLSNLLLPQRILVAGVMARAAAEESGLACEFLPVPPSVAIRGLGAHCFLAEQGKTPESGRIFGEIVASRLGDAGLIQVECASREVICWNRTHDPSAVVISHLTGFTLVERAVPPASPHEGVRTIRGCMPGEAVFVNGIIIGYATAPVVCLRMQGEQLTPVSGIRIKDHGIEKLQRSGRLDITRAWCKSGTLRSREPLHGPRGVQSGRVVFIDHSGHHLFNLLKEGGICGIVSVGDDTTAVCGHIGAHRGIPVLGIIDNDSDGIIPPCYAEGSILAIAQGMSDDELGHEVSRLVPEEIVVWEEFVARIVSYIGGRAKIITPCRDQTA